MDKLAEKIVELRLATRKACMCEEGSKALISLRTKALFLISKKEATSPFEIISELMIGKTNLAILAGQMEREELITKSRDDLDKREISYSLTEKGREYLEVRMAAISETFSGIFEGSVEYERAIAGFDEVLHLMSFLSIK